MGLIKLLVILSLIIYVISKIGGFFFRAGAASQTRFQQRPPQATGNTPPSPKSKRDSAIKGGEYVDYEEVK